MGIDLKDLWDHFGPWARVSVLQRQALELLLKEARRRLSCGELTEDKLRERLSTSKNMLTKLLCGSQSVRDYWFWRLVLALDLRIELTPRTKPAPEGLCELSIPSMSKAEK